MVACLIKYLGPPFYAKTTINESYLLNSTVLVDSPSRCVEANVSTVTGVVNWVY